MSAHAAIPMKLAESSNLSSRKWEEGVQFRIKRVAGSLLSGLASGDGRRGRSVRGLTGMEFDQ